MIVRCISNSGKVLLDYTTRPTGITNETEFGQLTVGQEYVVMGIILGEGMLDYLIDSVGNVFSCPYQLFEIIDSRMNSEWFVRTFSNSDDIFPYQQAIWGYYELCFENHYEKLVEKEEDAMRLYFKYKNG